MQLHDCPRPRLRLLSALCLCAVHVVTLSAQRPGGLPAAAASAPAKTGTLVIGGDVTQPVTFTTAELRGLPHPHDRHGRGRRSGTVTYEGVLVGELLKRAGAPIGSELRGNAVATYVIASASDGYQVVFSLAELDPAFTSNNIIVADTIDGKALFDYQGPIRIVAPKDMKGARSIRMLERIDVVRLRK